jgi:hypothetical protein
VGGWEGAQGGERTSSSYVGVYYGKCNDTTGVSQGKWHAKIKVHRND